MCSVFALSHTASHVSQCVERLGDDAMVCNVDVYCDFGDLSGKRCVSRGFDGVCSRQCYDSVNWYCPIDDSADELSDAQVNEWCQFVGMARAACQAAIDVQCTDFEPYCVASALGITVSEPRCERRTIECSAAASTAPAASAATQLCVENGNVGVCAPALGAANRSLICQDVSDVCPAGSTCSLATVGDEQLLMVRGDATTSTRAAVAVAAK